jgi:7-cyano-7-deazaguanine synthase
MKSSEIKMPASSDQIIMRSWRGRAELQASVARSGGRVVALVSGGLDSCVLLGCLAEVAGEVHPLFVRNGHPWEDAESAALRGFIDRLGALGHTNIRSVVERSLPLRDLLDAHWRTAGYHPGFSEGYSANFIPGRNLALLSVASLLAYTCDAGALALGLLAANPYPDASPRFFAAFETLFAEGMGRPLQILAPFVQLPKEEVVRIGEALSLPLELSLSCANPIDGEHCGDACNKCAERQKAFALAGIADPTHYRNPPPKVDWTTHKWPD